MKENVAKSYVDILSELVETIETDAIPETIRQEALLHIEIVSNILWPYSY